MDERRRQGGHPARRLGQSVAARERFHPLPDLPRRQRGDERQEDGHGRVAPEGPGGEDQDGQSDGVERVDDPFAPAHAVVRLERRVVEGPVAPLGEIALEGQVPVAEEAVRDHEVVRLVSLRSDRDMGPRRGEHEHAEHEREEEKAVRPTAGGSDHQREPGQGQREKRRTGQRPHPGERHPGDEENDRHEEARARRQGLPAPRRERQGGRPGKQGRHDAGARPAQPDPAGSRGRPTGGQDRGDEDPAGAREREEESS